LFIGILISNIYGTILHINWIGFHPLNNREAGRESRWAPDEDGGFGLGSGGRWAPLVED